MMGVERILFLDQFSLIGGGQRSLLALIKIFVLRRKKVIVAAPAGGAFEAAVLAISSEDLSFVPLPEINLTSHRKGVADYFRFLVLNVLILWRMLPLVRHAETVCVNGPRLFLAAYIISIFIRRKFIYYVRIEHKWLEKQLIRHIARSASTFRVIANSEFTARGIVGADHYRYFPKVISICNSIYPPYDQLEFVDRFSGRSSNFVFAIIGRVSPEKGHDILPVLAGAFPGSKFYIVGLCREEERAFLEGVIQAAPSQIFYRGFTNDVPAMISGLGIQISLVPSRWEEAFGLVAIESAAMSCLVIASDKGGLPDIAKRIGCDVFKDSNECISIINRFRELGSERLAARALDQHAKASKEFSYSVFEQEVISAFEGGGI